MENEIQFAKWFIHTRRKKLHELKETVDAKDFASNLMVELCHIEAFTKEHILITEYNEYLRTTVFIASKT